MTSYSGLMPAPKPYAIIHHARRMAWSPELLAQCFTDMPIEDAERFLAWDPATSAYTLDIEEDKT